SVTGGRATICGVSSGGAGAKIRISSNVPLPPDGEAIDIEGNSGTAGTPGGADTRIADAIYLPPGRGALVIEQRASGATSGAMYLVTDQGIRYPLGKDARKALGYEKARPTPVSATVLALLPFGPTLDRQAAARVVTVGSGGDSSGRAPAPGQPG
ncbi:MAG: type VII secretion protein EccB, partial [Micromonosporaceae bacterium]